MAGTKRIAKVRKDEDGDIKRVKYTDGSEETVRQAAARADRGGIEDVHAVHPKDGPPYVRSDPNPVKNDNLDRKPEF